jgi:hypothetical protein
MSGQRKNRIKVDRRQIGNKDGRWMDLYDHRVQRRDCMLDATTLDLLSTLTSFSKTLHGKERCTEVLSVSINLKFRKLTSTADHVTRIRISGRYACFDLVSGTWHFAGSFSWFLVVHTGDRQDSERVQEVSIQQTRSCMSTKFRDWQRSCFFFV